jgi:putative endonuclease
MNQKLNHLLGHLAEQRVKDWYLRGRGARLLAQNYRCKGGELDLVVEESENQRIRILVFVEVRVRQEPGWQSGIESIGVKKQLCLKKAASHFLCQYRGTAQEVRFDLVCWSGQKWAYYPNFLRG